MPYKIEKAPVQASKSTHFKPKAQSLKPKTQLFITGLQNRLKSRFWKMSA
jgi:hypothetical protein